jgi:hopanoid biosynthesis associated RND transporter like protein HpnN
VVLAGLPLLFWLRFDFNPLNLRSPKVESVATFLDISRDSVASVNTINIVAPSLAEADATAARLRNLPEVARTMTLSSFVPDHQPEKLKLIQKTRTTLKSALDPKNAVAPPTDQENIQALNDIAEDLEAAATEPKGPGAAAAKRLAANVSQLAKADQAARAKVEAAMVPPLKWDLDELRNFFKAQTITLKSLPAGLVRDWTTPDGHARAETAPKGNANDTETLRKFASAVLAVEPMAVGVPISILETGETVVSAFIQAGIWALLSISILLWITLRRIGDVLLTLIPLLMAGVVTLELCVLLDQPLNFANIIALPLMLGVGVAFKIYYIMAWRAGRTNLLQSNLTRAVMFSALTTATAFGSLWFSSHPGTSSMGKLLALSLLCTLAAAVLFQPLLMGKPRET